MALRDTFVTCLGYTVIRPLAIFQTSAQPRLPIRTTPSATLLPVAQEWKRFQSSSIRWRVADINQNWSTRPTEERSTFCLYYDIQLTSLLLFTFYPSSYPVMHVALPHSKYVKRSVCPHVYLFSSSNHIRTLHLTYDRSLHANAVLRAHVPLL
jgi:hypothetical protein